MENKTECFMQSLNNFSFFEKIEDLNPLNFLRNNSFAISSFWYLIALPVTIKSWMFINGTSESGFQIFSIKLKGGVGNIIGAIVKRGYQLFCPN